MIRLKEPSERYLDSYREAYREYQEHLGTPCFFGNPDQEELFLTLIIIVMSGICRRTGWEALISGWWTRKKTNLSGKSVFGIGSMKI